VLWSDHGYHLGEKGHHKKQTLWEECSDVPFIWVVPNVTTPGTICDRPVDLQSIYPTLCNLTGLDVPDHVDGDNIRPLLEDPDAEWDGIATVTMGRMNHAIVDQRYRYIRYEDGSEELYDHDNDPNEFENLATLGGEYDEIKARLSTHLPRTNMAIWDPKGITKKAINVTCNHEEVTVKRCPDGSFVARDPNMNCNFTECPVLSEEGEWVMLDSEPIECTDGVHVNCKETQEICGLEDEKAVNCGANAKSGRPLFCCDGLYCNKTTASCSALAIGDTSTCSGVNEKAVDCGTGLLDPDSLALRPQSCCENLYCGGSGGRCIPIPGSPTMAVTSSPTGLLCAADGEKASGCGATAKPSRPIDCCGGLVCHASDRICVPSALLPDAEASAGGAEVSVAFCAADGEKASGCGANAKPSRPIECCEGLECHTSDRICVRAKVSEVSVAELLDFEILIELAAANRRRRLEGNGDKSPAIAYLNKNLETILSESLHKELQKEMEDTLSFDVALTRKDSKVDDGNRYSAVFGGIVKFDEGQGELLPGRTAISALQELVLPRVGDYVVDDVEESVPGVRVSSVVTKTIGEATTMSEDGGTNPNTTAIVVSVVVVGIIAVIVGAFIIIRWSRRRAAAKNNMGVPEEEGAREPYEIPTKSKLEVVDGDDIQPGTPATAKDKNASLESGSESSTESPPTSKTTF